MKTLILTLLLFLSLSMAADNPKTKMFTNIEKHKSGSTKECTFIDEDMKPLEKFVYEYDKRGDLLSRTTYQWEGKKGWTALQKLDYQYNRNGKVANIIHTKWDRDLQAWSPESQLELHIYNNGRLQAVKQVKIEDNKSLYAGK